MKRLLHILAFAAALCVAAAESNGAASPKKPAAPAGPVIASTYKLPAVGEVVALPEIKKICAHYGLQALWLKIERDPPPLPFKSDGASGWVDEWNGISLYPATFLHDLKYWAGYPGEDVERLAADAEMMIDIARLLKSTTMAETMFRGVRVGGTEYLHASFSWGFGRRAGAVAP